MACAIAVDLSDFKHLVHGNHLGYGPLAWAFARLLGAERSLFALQALSGLLGAAGAAVFCSLLQRTGASPRDAGLGAAALAVSHAWWFWSLEAQVYMLGALFCALAAREALGESPDPRLAGFLHAGAMLAHAAHAVAAPAMLLALAGTGRRGLARYLSAAAGTVLAAYALAALLAVKPASAEEWRLWLLGSAALGESRAFEWHGAAPGTALASWLRMCVEIFWARGTGFWLGALPLLPAALALRSGSARARFWGAWLAGYAALFLLWEPGTIVYRITDLLALWALALEGLGAVPAPHRAAALAAWCAATAAQNLRGAILPASRAESNVELREALALKRDTPENAWALAVGRGQVYVPYFAERKPLNLRYLPDYDALAAKLLALERAGEPVYASDRALNESGRRAELEKYGLRPAGPGLWRVR